MEDLEQHQEDFDELGAVALEMSVNSAPSKEAWTENMGVENTAVFYGSTT
jgi:alkyl hydroperoxide reductase subunit AhpC